MSGSVLRPSPIKQAFRASVKADPGESALCNALSDADDRIDGLRRKLIVRVDNDAPAANYDMLEEMRRIADDIKAAADDYQWRRPS